MPLELGSWGIIKEPSLLALLPMVLFIVCAFNTKRIPALLGAFLCSVIGCILCGVNPAQFGAELGYAMNTTLGKVGMLCMLGSALGTQMEHCGVSKTLCKWIVKGIHVNSLNKGIAAVSVCEFVVSVLLGSMSTAAAVISPILIPISASVGLSACALSTLVQTIGEAGMVCSPFSGPVVALLEVTGVGYAEYFIWGAIPFSIVFIVSILFATKYVQKKYGADELYDPEKYVISDEPASSKERNASIAFIIAFAVSVAYAVVTNQGLDFVIVIEFLLFIILCVFGGTNAVDGTGNFVKGCGKSVSVFLLNLFYQFMMDTIELGGGFVALESVFSNMSGINTPSSMLAVATLVGSFAVNGGAAAQIKIIHNLFWPLLAAMNVPMVWWLMILICGHRATNNIYPQANMIIPMGLFGAKSMKTQLIGCWISAAAAMIVCLIWSYLAPLIF